jgi:hypothetical protein
VLDELDVPHRWPAGSPERGVYCSRTLNLRSIKAIGYDMDYTLIHYDVNAWEVTRSQPLLRLSVTALQSCDPIASKHNCLWVWFQTKQRCLQSSTALQCFS